MSHVMPSQRLRLRCPPREPQTELQARATSPGAEKELRLVLCGPCGFVVSEQSQTDLFLSSGAKPALDLHFAGCYWLRLFRCGFPCLSSQRRSPGPQRDLPLRSRDLARGPTARTRR